MLMSSWRRSRRWTCRSCRSRSRSRSTLPSRLCWLTLQQIKYLCLLLSYTFIQKLLNGHFGFGFGFGVIFRWWVIASSRVIEEDQRRRRRRRRQRQRQRRQQQPQQHWNDNNKGSKYDTGATDDSNADDDKNDDARQFCRHETKASS